MPSTNSLRFVNNGPNESMSAESVKLSKLSWTGRRPSSVKSSTHSTRRPNSYRLTIVAWSPAKIWNVLARVKREERAERSELLYALFRRLVGCSVSV